MGFKEWAIGLPTGTALALALYGGMNLYNNIFPPGPPPPEPVETTAGSFNPSFQTAVIGSGTNELSIQVPSYGRPYEACVNAAHRLGKDPGGECNLHEEIGTQVGSGVETVDVWRTSDGGYGAKVKLLNGRGEKTDVVVSVKSCNGDGDCSYPATYTLSIVTDRTPPSINGSQTMVNGQSMLTMTAPDDTTKLTIADCVNGNAAKKEVPPYAAQAGSLFYSTGADDVPGLNCRLVQAIDRVGNSSETQIRWEAPVTVVNPQITTQPDGTWTVRGQLTYNPAQLGNPGQSAVAKDCSSGRDIGKGFISPNGVFEVQTKPGYDEKTDSGCVAVEGSFAHGKGSIPVNVDYRLAIRPDQIRAQQQQDGSISLQLLTKPPAVSEIKTVFEQQDWRALFAGTQPMLREEQMQQLGSDFSVQVTPPRRKGEPYRLSFSTCDQFGNCSAPISFALVDPPDPHALEVFAMKTVPELGSIALLLSGLLGAGYAAQKEIKRRTNTKRMQSDVDRYLAHILSGEPQVAVEYLRKRYPGNSPIAHEASKRAQSTVLEAFHRAIQTRDVNTGRSALPLEQAIRLYNYISVTKLPLLNEQTARLAGLIEKSGSTPAVIRELSNLRNRDLMSLLRLLPEDMQRDIRSSIIKQVVSTGEQYKNPQYRSYFGEPIMTWLATCWNTYKGEDREPMFRGLVDSLTPQERQQAMEQIQTIARPDTRLSVLSYFVDSKMSSVNEDRLRYTAYFMKAYAEEIQQMRPNGGIHHAELFVREKLGQATIARLGTEMVTAIAGQVERSLLANSSRVRV